PASTPPPARVSAADRKAGRAAFSRALKLRARGKIDEAFDLFQRAASLNPNSAEYLTAREIARQQIIYGHLQSGNADMLAGNQVHALGEFRSALQLDPTNDFALQRLRDA